MKPENGSAFDCGLVREVFAALFLAPMPHVYGTTTASYARLKLSILTQINSAGGGGSPTVLTGEGGEKGKARVFGFCFGSVKRRQILILLD